MSNITHIGTKYKKSRKKWKNIEVPNNLVEFPKEEESNIELFRCEDCGDYLVYSFDKSEKKFAAYCQDCSYMFDTKGILDALNGEEL
jgi:hypothetical protein